LKYYERASPVHRASPALKLLLVFTAVLLSVVFIDAYLQLALLAAVLASLFLAKLPLKQVFRFAMPLVLVSPIFILVYSLTRSAGSPPIDIAGLRFYYAGVVFGSLVSLRFITVGFSIPLIIMTTKPNQMIRSLRPLMPRSIALALAILFRFIPLFWRDFNRISMSQQSRAAKKDLRYLISVMAPLFYKAFKRSKTLAYSMESRGFSMQ
jgi:energy-coupling factor transport system permease protein